MKDELQSKVENYLYGDVQECVPRLLAYIDSLHIAHWRADTTTTEHTILGNLYEGLTDMVDEFTEVYMGKYGKLIEFPSDAKIEDVSKKPVSKGLELINKIKPLFKAGKDDDLINILADMEIELNKSKYLLKEN